MSTTVNQVEKIEYIEQTAVSKGNSIPVQSESTPAFTLEISNNYAQQSNVDDGKYDSATLKQALTHTLNYYNISYDDALEILKKILDIKNEEDLLSASDSINNTLKILNEILEKSINKETDEVDISNAIELAKEYNTEVPKSEEVKNDPELEHVKELAKTLGLENVKSVNDISVAIKMKYGAACDALKENPEAMEDFVAWFQTALTNISDEDKNIFLEMLDKLDFDNNEINKKILDIFASSIKDGEEFFSICNSSDSTFMQKLATAYTATRETKSEISQFNTKVDKKMNETCSSEEFAKYEETLANGGKLSQQEQSKYDAYIGLTAVKSSITEGVLQHGTLNNDDRENLIKEIVLSAQQFPTYRRYLENIARYVEEHPDNISIGRERFEELMDEVSNGNYFKVVNDIKNKETTELVITKSGEDNQSGSTETGFASGTSSTSEPTGNTLGSLGFTQKELPKNISEKINNQKEPQKTPTIDENTGLDVSATPSTVQVLTTTNVKAVKKEKGILKTVYDVAVGVVKAVDEVVDELVEDIKGLGKTFQCLLLSVASGNFFNEMITNLKDSVLIKFNESGLKGRSFDQTQKIKEHFSQIESKN